MVQEWSSVFVIAQRPRMSKRVYIVIFTNFSFFGVQTWTDVQKHTTDSMSYCPFKYSTQTYYYIKSHVHYNIIFIISINIYVNVILILLINLTYTYVYIHHSDDIELVSFIVQ